MHLNVVKAQRIWSQTPIFFCIFKYTNVRGETHLQLLPWRLLPVWVALTIMCKEVEKLKNCFKVSRAFFVVSSLWNSSNQHCDVDSKSNDCCVKGGCLYVTNPTDCHNPAQSARCFGGWHWSLFSLHLTPTENIPALFQYQSPEPSCDVVRFLHRWLQPASNQPQEQAESK